MASPPPQRAWAAAMYDARAPTYDASWHPTFAAHMASLLSPPPGAHILDLAAGTGLATYALAARVAPTGSVLGIDASSGMLALAQRKHAAFTAEQRGLHGCGVRGPIARFVVGDVAALDDDEVAISDGDDGLFDGAMCASALVLLRDPRAAVASWLRRVRAGGRLVVDVPHEHNQRALALMEIAAARAGVAVPFFRAWVTGAAAVRELVDGLVDGDGARMAVVERVEFVAQAGYGVRRYTKGREDAEELFEGALGPLRVEGDGVRERLWGAFVGEWMAAFEEGEGVVEDVDGVYVAVVRRL